MKEAGAKTTLAGAVVKRTRTSLVNLEALTDEELDALREEFEKLQGRREKSRAAKRA